MTSTQTERHDASSADGETPPDRMPVLRYSQAQMQRRVARFSELSCPPNRYPDSHLPGHERRNYLVIGRGLQVDGAADPMSAIPIAEGFQLAYATMRPGNGPRMHNHDTNETFIALKGTWRVLWGLGPTESVDLKPLDVCSLPPFVPRSFLCLTAEPGEEEGLLMAVIAGDEPRSEFI